MARPFQFVLLYLGLISLHIAVEWIGSPFGGFSLLGMLESCWNSIQGVEGVIQFHPRQAELGANALWIALFVYLTLIGALSFLFLRMADRLMGVRHFDIKA